MGNLPFGGIEIKFDPAELIDRDTAMLAEVDARVAGIYDQVHKLMACLPRLERCREGLRHRIEANQLELLAASVFVEQLPVKTDVVELPTPEPRVVDEHQLRLVV